VRPRRRRSSARTRVAARSGAPQLPRHTRGGRAQGNVDGVFFGTTFPHLLLMTYPSLRPPRPTETYVPRVFGFRLHESALERPPAEPAAPRQNGAPRARGQPLADPLCARPRACRGRKRLRVPGPHARTTCSASCSKAGSGMQLAGVPCCWSLAAPVVALRRGQQHCVGSVPANAAGAGKRACICSG